MLAGQEWCCFTGVSSLRWSGALTEDVWRRALLACLVGRGGGVGQGEWLCSNEAESRNARTPLQGYSRGAPLAPPADRTARFAGQTGIGRPVSALLCLTRLRMATIRCSLLESGPMYI